MARRNPNDISIGEDEWITFIDIAGRQDIAVSIDRFVALMEPFWRALEINCIAGCCGIDAFALWPEDIRKAAAVMERQALAGALASLRQFAVQSRSDVFVSDRLNNYFDRQVLLRMIDHIYGHAIYGS